MQSILRKKAIKSREAQNKDGGVPKGGLAMTSASSLIKLKSNSVGPKMLRSKVYGWLRKISIKTN